MPNFVYIPPTPKCDAIIKPINENYRGNINHVTIYRGGDAIFYKNKSGVGKRYDIASDASPFCSLSDGLPSDDRLRGLDDVNLKKLSVIIGVSLDDLIEIRELEKEHNPPKPYIYERYLIPQKKKS